jgi:hypothetical protein
VGNIFGEPQIFAFLHTLGRTQTVSVFTFPEHHSLARRTTPDQSGKSETPFKS